MNVWGVLRIAPTDDIAAIRSAYAKALKTIDMDTDPQSYIALRDARDEAIAGVRQRAWEAAQARAEDEPIVADAAPEVHVEVPAGDFNSHFASIMRLLEAEPAAPLGDAEAAIVRAEFAAALKDAQMDELSFRAQSELQLAQLVASFLPRAETLAAPMIAAFGWNTPARVDTPPAIAAILDHVRTAAEHRAIQIDTGRLPAVAPAPAPHIEVEIDGELLTTTSNAEFYGEQYNAIAQLLFPPTAEGETAPPLTPDQQQKLREHFATLIADPRMELVGFSAGAETEIAQLIAYSVPRSDPIVTAAIDFFGWEETEGRIDQAGMVAHILNRARGLRFIDAVRVPGHDYYAAWGELRKPLSDDRWWSFLTPQVAPHAVLNLLTAIRTQQPLLENELDADRVSAWETRLNKGSNPGAWRTGVLIACVIAGWLVLTIISAQFQSPIGNSSSGNVAFDPLPAYPPENDRFADGRRRVTAVGDEIQASDADAIDPILERIGGPNLTYSGLAYSNPGMHTMIQEKLHGAREANQSRGDFAFAMGEILRERVRAGLHSSNDYVAIADYQRLVLAALKERATPAQCIALARAPYGLIDEPSLSTERRNVFARILTQVAADAPPVGLVDGRRVYDMATLKKIGDRIGESNWVTVSAILAGESGTPGIQCLAHIVALEVLLEMPPAEAQKQLTL